MAYNPASGPTGWHRTVAHPSNGVAIAGLVCGVLGLFFFGIFLGVLAVVFGGIGLARARRGAAHRTMSIWAVGLGVAGIVYWAIVVGLMSH